MQEYRRDVVKTLLLVGVRLGNIEDKLIELEERALGGSDSDGDSVSVYRVNSAGGCTGGGSVNEGDDAVAVGYTGCSGTDTVASTVSVGTTTTCDGGLPASEIVKVVSAETGMQYEVNLIDQTCTCLHFMNALVGTGLVCKHIKQTAREQESKPCPVELAKFDTPLHYLPPECWVLIISSMRRFTLGPPPQEHAKVYTAKDVAEKMEISEEDAQTMIDNGVIDPEEFCN